MADESETLVQNEVAEENIITVGDREPRIMTCNKGKIMPALAIFVALLIAGQAVSVYFITQQQSKINELAFTTQQMKLNDMIKNLPGTPHSQNRPKLRMATFNSPLALRDDDGTQQSMEQEAMKSNSVEDAARYMLLMSNPLRKYQSFNGSVLDNLRKLKRTLSYEEWMLFDAWMQQWYLFYLVQNSKAPETPTPNRDTVTDTSVPIKRKLPDEFGTSGNLVYAPTSYSSDSFPSITDETPSGAPLMTNCQIKAQQHVLPGAYVPQCDDNGDYEAMQCWRSTGYCWCAYRNGTAVPDTRTRAKVDCSGFSEPMMDDMVDY